MKKYFTVGFILVFGILLFLGYKLINKQPLNYITIDINPSVQLALNEDNEVTEVLALNEDADVILAGLDLIGKDVEEATQLIIDSATETGYIDEYTEENLVTISGYNENNTDEEANADLEELKEMVKAKVMARLEEKNIYGEVVLAIMTDELKAEAEELNISNGKMLLVEKAYTTNNELSKEDLANMSIKEIQSEIKKAIEERHEEKKENYEELKQFKIENFKKEVELRIQNTDNAMSDNIKEIQEQYKEATEEQKKEIINEFKETIKNNIKAKIEQRNSNEDPDSPTSNTNDGNESSNGNNN